MFLVGGSRFGKFLDSHWHRLSTKLVNLLDRLQLSEITLLLGTALAIGIGGGLGAVFFRRLIDSFGYLFFVRFKQVLASLDPYYVILIPAIGGLFVGPLTYFFAREAKGHGVPEVMEAVALRGGRIRPIVAVIKSLASSICIGSGGSVGREGPIVQIGSALGSTLGQALHLSEERIRNLAACGAAAGIAATFNAPIAGAIFALEVILGEFSAGYFSTVVVSAVTASVVGRVFMGDVPAFKIPAYSLVSIWELPFYTILGALAALFAVLYIMLLYRWEDLFNTWQFPEYLKPAIGGLGVGLIGLYLPEVFGVGYPTIEKALLSELATGGLFLLSFAKLLATCITLGSGGSGGVFAPSLFIGATLGGAFGRLVNFWFPSITATSGAYAVVGTAAVFAGAARAPITAILILFEMTGDYRLILPLMLATVISMLLAERLHPDSIYTLKLTRRGIRLERGHDIDVMQGITVGEVMTSNVQAVSTDMDLQELITLFQHSHYHGFPVVDDRGELCGIVTIQDMERAIDNPRLKGSTVSDIATRSPLVAYPDESMWVALRRMGSRDLGRLPVVDRQHPKKLLGMLLRSDIVRAYNRAILRKMEFQYRSKQLRLGKLSGTEFVEIELKESWPVAGKRISEIKLPLDSIIVSIRRGRRVIIPHGDTIILPRDRMTVLVASEEAQALKDSFSGQASTP